MRASRAQAELAILRTFAGIVLAIFGYAGATTGAVGPSWGSFADLDQGPRASLVLSGDELMITGSIDHLFATATFTGTNKAKKRDRYRPGADVDVVEVTSTFDAIRARLRALRDSRGGMPEETASGAPEDMAVASLSPDMSSAALGAIDAAAEAAPMFSTQSEMLAYARADVPATVFDGTIKDKNGNKVSEKEFQCMATAIYFEARGETYRGQVAVGQVVLNRVAHGLYPDTICSVVYQNQHKRNACQFSFACDGIPERVTESAAWEQAEEIARGVISGELFLEEVAYATHYHATYVYPHWAPRMKKEAKIGLHVFYRFKRGWKFG